MFEGNGIEETHLRRLHRQATDLHKHLSAGNGKGNSFFKPAPVKAAKALIDLLAELGEGASTTADISEAKNSLNQLLTIRECEKEWGTDRISPESATLSKRRAQIENALLQLSQVREIVSESKKIKQLFSGSLHSLFGSETEIQKLRNCLEVRDHNKNLGQAEQTLVSVIKNLDLQICDLEVHSSIKRLAEAARVRDIREYETAHRLVSNTLVQITDAATYDGLIQTLTLHAPKFAISLTEGSVSDDQINNFDAAWNWSRAQSFLDQYRKYGKENTLKEQLSKLHEQKRELTGEFAGQLAWRHALKNVNPAQAQSLMGYQLALKKIGAGTGKNASKYRNDARKELDRCEGAVPVWIMPTYRVAELMKMEAEKFDVVIIDEASQSSLDALFLLWLGKQIVVVGDDEQISPMNMSGKIVGQLQSLQKKHLMEIEADHIFDPKSSLFDIAKIKLGVSICLVEHFRCMPEIIEFSNRNFYVPRNKSLQPLRQFGTDRLVPLMHKFVPGELSEIGKFNELEGREIVDQIIACHSDPAYDGKTFGVINLHSSSKQHEWIRNQLLHSSFGAEGIEERQLQFGTPNQFQGAERDVIFLSMVVSQHPEGRKLRRYGSNTGEAQRLNVAASRAKDQMWLFHSVTLADLSPKCLRAAFISHFNEPPVLDVQPFTAPVDRHYPQKPFRSLFEQRVFLDIRERGYVVQPAYKAGGYEIDMVVAGEGGRLAIECDGSHWHNAETKDHDDFREENLKRVGWKFFRLPDFDYYANQTKSLEPLWEQLAEEGIYPTGHVPDTASPSLPDARCVEAEAVVSNINQINKDLVHLTERQAPRACNQAMPAEV
jgi:very-short-patch-repair endonuclease